MTLAKNKLAAAIAIALTTSLGLVGCGDDKSVSTSVGVPNPNTLVPTGTIQGVLRDTVTNEPIVGAVVDIGIAKATTTETGQFVIKNVPATGSIGAAGAGANAPYEVTVDLRNVKQATGAAKYPDFSFATAAVSYSSLNDGSNNDAGTSSSNHDTPVTGLTAPLALTVGKLAAGIKGVVVKDTTLAPVGAGYTVKLVSLGSANSAVAGKGGTGAPENVVATVTTGADGAFSFSNVESLRDFRLDVENADVSERGAEDVTSPADGQIKTLLPQRGDDALDLRTVFVSTTDTLMPKVLKATPENGAEIAPGANVTVKFAFSEPIVSNALTNSLSSASTGNGGLYDLVAVNFNGIKAGNIPHSLSWNTARTELTVTIPTVAAASRYQVDISGAAGILLDNQNNAVNFAAPGTRPENNGVVEFTTNGAVQPAIVTTLAITNRTSLNNTGNVTVDWLPVSGAKGYHVYRAKSVHGAAFGAFERLDADGPVDANNNGIDDKMWTEVSEFSDMNVNFVEGDLKVTYKYMVRPVSFDNIESGDSTSVEGQDIAQDNTAPSVDVINNISTASRTVTVWFDEPMDEASAETLANYALAATTGANAPQVAPSIPALNSAVYNRDNGSVTLTYASNVPAGTTLTVTGVKDVAGKTMETTGNTASVAKVTSTINHVAGSSQVTVSFFSQMDEVSAETVANYVWTITPATPALNPAPTLPSCTPVLGFGGFTVTLTCTAAIPAGVTLTVSGVKDTHGTVADGDTLQF